ncbi:hypothetical protein QQS21_004128 [Conoideocrella luteorostrata]|uniref:Lysine-specific metallo-endopeptidase domain-containing protein n=1 Tax=Conoideocrella luteorostrata TaxID=1105319 RepID=A0AAJ0FVQ8_9HYPO|nr:hypothetical protein QQS21_004128 [Conoideocrella luteorostrata]
MRLSWALLPLLGSAFAAPLLEHVTAAQTVSFVERDGTQQFTEAQKATVRRAASHLPTFFHQILETSSEDTLFKRYFGGSSKKPATRRAQRVKGVVRDIVQTLFGGDVKRTKNIDRQGTGIIYLPGGTAAECGKAGVAAYAARTYKTIVLCDLFFQQPPIGHYKNQDVNPRKIKRTQTFTLFHEIMHLSDYEGLDHKRITDLQYGSEHCHNIRHDKGDKSPLYNADSYTWLANDRVWNSWGHHLGFNGGT